MTLTSKLAPPSDRRQRRSAEIRERLFRSALALFAEKGFAETTVEDISKAADVGSFRDVLDCGFRKAFLGEQGKRGAEEALADLGAAALAAVGRRRELGSERHA